MTRRLPWFPMEYPEKDQMYRILLCSLNIWLKKINSNNYHYLSFSDKSIQLQQKRNWPCKYNQKIKEEMNKLQMTYLLIVDTRQILDEWMWLPAFACPIYQKDKQKGGKKLLWEHFWWRRVLIFFIFLNGVKIISHIQITHFRFHNLYKYHELWKK